MKIVAGIGLFFFLYCLIQIIVGWQHRSKIEKMLWFLVIAVGSSLCVSVFIH